MAQTLPNRSRYSSTKRFNPKLDQPLPPVLSDRERIQFILTAVENVCYKLERCMDNQNQKIKAIETKLSDALVDKFDKLIECNERVARVIERGNLKPGARLRPSSVVEGQRLAQSKEMERSVVREEPSMAEDAAAVETTEATSVPPTAKSNEQSNKPAENATNQVTQPTGSQLPEPVLLQRKDSIPRKPFEQPLQEKRESIQKRKEELPQVSIMSKPGGRPSLRRQEEEPERQLSPPLMEIDSPITPQKSQIRSSTKIIVSNQNITEAENGQTIQVFHPPEQPKKLFALLPVPVASNVPSIMVREPEPTKQQFMTRLMHRMRDFHTNLAQVLYEQFSSGRILYRDMKIRYSWEMMNFYFDLNKEVIDGPSEFLGSLSNRMHVTKMIDRTTRNILQFLIRKYPPSKSKIIDTELSKQIVEVNRTFDLQNDILLNAGMSFVAEDQRDYTRSIKQWLNMLISETKAVYPTFKQIIKEIFTDGDNSLAGEQTELEYEIGRKINEATPLYTPEQLEMPGLQLKAPELLRILVKWTEELASNFQQADKKIIGNKSGFKSVTRGLSISLTLKRKELLAQNLRNIYKQDIEKRISNRQRHMYNIINELMTMALAGFRGYEYLNEREVLIAKISHYFSQCSETYTLKMLNNLLAGLNKTRSRYQNILLESSVDLVTFNVMDIMRCRCVGSRQQILRIYKEIDKRRDDFEIVRVKNKLNESTRDILINFRFRKSFLVCEMQLALGDSKDEVNDHFCHNLYEMERSVFPVLFENASILVNLDTRTGYFDSSRQLAFCSNPRFTGQTLRVQNNRVYCQNSHEPYQMVFHSNSAPYCCSYCSKFIGSYCFSLEYLRCYKCMSCICPKCLLGNCNEFMLTYLYRNQRITDISEFVRVEPYYSGFGSNAEIMKKVKEALREQQLFSYVVVNQFDRKGLKTNIYKLVDQQVVRAFLTLEEIKADAVMDSPDNWSVIWLPENPLTLKLTQLRLHYKYCHLPEYPWHRLEELLSGMQEVICVLNSQQKKVMILDIVEDPVRIATVLTKQLMQIHITQQNKKAQLNLELTTKSLSDLRILKRVQRKQMVKSLNLSENQLIAVAQLKEFTGVQDLNLRDNQIETIREVLYIGNLQYLDLHNNRLAGNLPKLDFPSLKTLDISQNQLVDVSSLSQSALQLLAVLVISHNKLTELPVLVCPNLEIYFFSHNLIDNLDNFALSRIKQVRKIYGFNNLLWGELPDLSLPNMEAIRLEDNKIEGLSGLAKWNLPALQYLNLSCNNISGGIPIIKGLPSLRRLDVSQNRLTDVISVSLCELNSLKSVDLSNNQFKGPLPKLSFPLLESMTMGFNKLTSMNNLEISALPRLDTLMLNSNLLEQLPILKLPRLRHIDLSNNNIMGLAPMIEWRLPRIQIILINSNALVGSIPLLFMDSLEELHVDSNDITKIECLSEKQLIPQIKVISVRNNKTKLLEGGCLVMNASRTFHRALSGIWKSRSKPADYNVEPDNLE